VRASACDALRCRHFPGVTITVEHFQRAWPMSDQSDGFNHLSSQGEGSMKGCILHGMLSEEAPYSR
jgi:hypothetical protein